MPPANARVLELGCAAGGNIIPFAARHPGATVVGIDLSGVQVGVGQQAIEATGLKNITLKQGSIADLDKSIGQFDYIICHGVYSWVPEDVRAAILRICGECLSTNGIAYISYNAYPGWKAKEIVRDAMLLRAAGRPESERLAYARGLVDFMHDNASPGSLLQKVMEDNIKSIREHDSYYLAHEYLERCNNPYYFQDFIAAARTEKLDYLAEANIVSMFLSNHPKEIAEPLLQECGGSQVVLEQLLDFISNRTFRQTLLVRQQHVPNIAYRLNWDRMRKLHVACVSTPDPENPDTWKTRSGISLFTSRPVPALVVKMLNDAWPSSVSVDEIVKHVSQHYEDQPATQPVAEAVALETIQSFLTSGVLKFRVDPVMLGTLTPSTRPHVDPVIRKLAEFTADKQLPLSISNGWHEPLARFDSGERDLLALLDGTRTVDELVDALYASYAATIQLPASIGTHVMNTQEDLKKTVRDSVKLYLDQFASIALLTPSSDEKALAAKLTPKPAAAPATAAQAASKSESSNGNNNGSNAGKKNKNKKS
ncbi:methyltransferase regulatory domain-containing protein [Paraburkholderia bonniea]|uniref:methyltransferase regulatory domain-containing protein n=1 Tax=Paraburkholderia bonniea TaxID=2152891 RepID=UPI001292735E|nr:class I SAM-dependent methyltransferase [Paraburkholderia bonniea]